MIGIDFLHEPARQLAMELCRTQSGLDAMREQANACEKRFQECHNRTDKHPCPSYIHCLIGKCKNIMGGDMITPVCPRTVVAEFEKLQKQFAELK